ncbi:MAG: DEAD/DEAH box helicase [Proteobacteria bacterium]|nr:DEAD/DEAH box helicase [Pseudomonadota bacterium]
MLWNYWSLSELQSYLSEFDCTLLDRLEGILPALEIHDYDPTQLFLKKNMVKVIEAFAPSDCFRSKSFMRTCLDHLPPDELAELAEAVGAGTDAETFDDRREAIVAKNWSDQQFARSFIDHFHLADHFLAPEPAHIPHFEDFTVPTADAPVQCGSAYKPLKDYQFHVYSDALEKLGIERSRFIIQMPTGSGKTRTAMEFITRFIDAAPPNVIVVWLAHSEELCEQAFQCFKEVWVHVATRKLRAYRAWSNHSMPASYDLSMFIVGGFQKLHAEIKKFPEVFHALRSRVGLIVVDEAHKTIAPTYKRVIQNLINDTAHVVGLTATPGRTIIEETHELAEFYFADMVGINAPDNQSVTSMLRDRKILSKLIREPIIASSTYKLTSAQRRRLEQDFDFPRAFLDKVAEDDVRNIEIMKKLIRECEEGRNILFFACSVKHSQFITALLIYFGYAAAHVDGSTDSARRVEIIDHFKKGRIQVLSNYGVLSTGFDAPNTDVVFIARPTNSVVLYGQMIGRGLRGPAIGGTASCKLIDVRDNIIGFGDQDRLYRYFEDYWFDQFE